MKTISIMVPCYNEKNNIIEMYNRIYTLFSRLEGYDYNLVFADNCSVDGSCEVIKKLCEKDKNVSAIFNNRNFGVERSCTNAFLQCYGDAVVIIAADLQDPPEMIEKFISYWEKGYKLVLGQKKSTKDKFIINKCRKLYYNIMNKLVENGHISGVTGFGLYDREVMDMLRWMDDPLPYTRGIICDLGYSIKLVEYDKNERKRGKSSYNFYKYFDAALWGIVSSSRKPLRWVTLTGFFGSFLSIILLILILTVKRFRNQIMLSTSLLMLLGFVIILCIGIVGEYIGLILLKTTKRPFTTSKQMINMEQGENVHNKMYGH